MILLQVGGIDGSGFVRHIVAERANAEPALDGAAVMAVMKGAPGILEVPRHGPERGGRHQGGMRVHEMARGLVRIGFSITGMQAISVLFQLRAAEVERLAVIGERLPLHVWLRHPVSSLGWMMVRPTPFKGEQLVSRFRSSYPALACTSRVRRQKRSMLARISSADLVHRSGFGFSFCRRMNISIAAISSLTEV